MPNSTRRQMLTAAAGWFGALAGPAFGAPSAPTPRQPAGPFYPPELPLDDDNDLTTVAGANAPARGTVSDLSGHLLDSGGQPLSGLRIEIWQCDANGRYRHPHDAGDLPVDPGFQGHGHTVTEENGRYRFRTIRPVPYPGRTPHIHVAVLDRRRPLLVTQLYVAGDPRNGEDVLFNRVPVEQRPLVLAAFTGDADSGRPLEAGWDIVLSASPGQRRVG